MPCFVSFIKWSFKKQTNSLSIFYFRQLDFSDLISLLYIIQAARETGALQAAKNKLEKQVEELTWRLQLEKRMRVCMAMNLLQVVILEMQLLRNALA